MPIAAQHGHVHLNQIDASAERRLRRLRVLGAHDDAETEEKCESLTNGATPAASLTDHEYRSA